MSIFKKIRRIKRMNMKKLSVVSYDTNPNYPTTSEGISDNLSIADQIDLMRMF